MKHLYISKNKIKVLPNLPISLINLEFVGNPLVYPFEIRYSVNIKKSYIPAEEQGLWLKQAIQDINEYNETMKMHYVIK